MVQRGGCVVSQQSLLVSTFAVGLIDERRPLVEGYPGLGAALEQACLQAASQWPALAIEPKDFVRYMANVLNQHPPKNGLEDWFAHLQVADLYLVYGCSFGLEDALSSFESSFSTTIKKVVRRFQKDMATGEDLYQIVNEKLFVGGRSSGPKLLSYAGQGYLENWLRVTSTRMCLDVVRGGAQQKREVYAPEDSLQDLPDAGLDLELDFLKREYRGHFKTAFTEALTTLSSGERNLLRQHLVARLSLEQIAALYHIHRATAARRLAKARQSLLQSTREILMRELSISENEFDSIMGLIQSRLDVSVQRLLTQKSTSLSPDEEEG